MSKPKLLVLQNPRRYFDMLTYVESDPVRGHFDVRKVAEFNMRTVRSRQNLPDLVYCQSYGPFHEELARCRKWGVPYVVHVGGTFPRKNRTEWVRTGKRLLNMTGIMRGAALVVCNSKFLRRQFHANLGLDNLTTLPGGLWGLDHTPIGPMPSRFRPKEDYSLRGRPVVVMSVTLVNTKAKSHKWSGVPALFDAVKGLKSRRGKPVFVAAGRNNTKFPLLKKWNRMCELHIRPSHHLDDGKDVWPDVLRRADMFVHPGMFDCWPRVIGDAMCAAAPSLVFDTTGNGEVGDEVVKVDPGDREAIRRAFEALLTDEGLRRKVGTRARAEALHKTEKHRGDYAKLLLEVLRCQK